MRQWTMVFATGIVVLMVTRPALLLLVFIATVQGAGRAFVDRSISAAPLPYDS